MKRFIILAGILLLLPLLAACTASQERVDANAYERIHRQLLNMESFVARATVTYISNANTHSYETLQHARATGEYRIEVTAPANVAGNTTVFDGSMISQFNPRVSGRVAQTTMEAPERLEILLTSFVRNFAASEEVSISAATINEAIVTVLEAQVPGDHPYLATERLWICNDTLLPKQMIIYDANGVERIIVIFHSFEYNVDIDDNMFRVVEN